VAGTRAAGPGLCPFVKPDTPPAPGQPEARARGRIKPSANAPPALGPLLAGTSGEGPLAPKLEGVAFTCPRCGRTSHHPEDARQGYCGACGDWTGPGVPGEGTARDYQCESCGQRMAVPPEHVGRVWCPCGSARAMAPAPWVTASAIEFRPSDIRVVSDPSVPAGHIMLVNSQGLWQYVAHTGPGPRSGGADIDAVVRYIGEVYGQGPLMPEFESAAERIGEGMAAYRNGLMPLADLSIQVSGHLDQAMTDLITGSQRNPVTDSGDHPAPPAAVELEADEIPWANPMRWYPVDGE
jgi:predicted RNA-binding Zn-ribbon protein involved in translation (DUF1610 family)